MVKYLSDIRILYAYIGAGGGTRTHKPVTARDFKSRVFTSFTTPAIIYIQKLGT